MNKGLILLVSLIFIGSTHAQGPEEAFSRGNEAYRSGRFQQAVSEYESILKQGLISSEVYFNLGNAYYRQGNIAKAILAYERARRLAPDDPDVEHNLKLANLRTVDRIEPVPELFLISWIRIVADLLPLATTASIAVAGWVVFFFSFALLYGIRKPNVVRFTRWCVPASFIAVVLFGAVLTVQMVRFADRTEAIVVSPVVTAKNSPDLQSVDAFVLHQGLKVKLGDQVGDWTKIILADGKVGWIHNKDCERI